VNADLIQESTGYDGLDSTKELEGECFDVFAEGDEVDPRSTRGRTLPATSDMNLPSGNNISGLQDVPSDDTQFPQLAVAAASPHQSDWKNDHLQKQLRRSDTRNDHRKLPRTTAPIRLDTTARTTSATSKSTDLEEPSHRFKSRLRTRNENSAISTT
jgi:hypothetical protein